MELAKLFGNETAAKALVFIARYEQATAKEISDAFQISKTQTYNQLIKLVEAGILSRRELGNQKIYSFNSRLSFRKELIELLSKYIEFNMPMADYRDFYLIRRRARKPLKPLRGSYASN